MWECLNNVSTEFSWLILKVLILSLTQPDTFSVPPSTMWTGWKIQSRGLFHHHFQNWYTLHFTVIWILTKSQMKEHVKFGHTGVATLVYRHLKHYNLSCLFNSIVKQTPTLCITSVMLGESTSNHWFLITKGQWCRKHSMAWCPFEVLEVLRFWTHIF